MADMTEMSEAAQDQILAAVKAGHAAIIDGVRAWASTVESATPDSLRSVDIPGLDALPGPKQMVDLSFDFAEKLMAAQKDFAEGVLAAGSPVLGKAPAKKSA